MHTTAHNFANYQYLPQQLPAVKTILTVQSLYLENWAASHSKRQAMRRYTALDFLCFANIGKINFYRHIIYRLPPPTPRCFAGNNATPVVKIRHFHAYFNRRVYINYITTHNTTAVNNRMLFVKVVLRKDGNLKLKYRAGLTGKLATVLTWHWHAVKRRNVCTVTVHSILFYLLAYNIPSA